MAASTKSKISKLDTKLIEKAFTAAKTARKNAHAPYSKFSVGAALVLEDDQIFSGCNVENASYGATICAERTAIFSAVAAKGKITPKAIVLVTEPSAVPCGMCLQVMAEFMDKEAQIFIADSKKIQKQVCLKDLLPESFRFIKD